MPQLYFENSSLETQKEINQIGSESNVFKLNKSFHKKKQKPGELVHNIIGNTKKANNNEGKCSIAKPRNLDVFMKGNSILNANKINSCNIDRESRDNAKETQDMVCSINKMDTKRSEYSGKPAIASFAKTTKPVKFEKRLLPVKQTIAAPRPLKKNKLVEEEEESLIDANPSSMGFDSPCLIVKRSNSSYLEMSPLHVDERVSSTEVHIKSMKEKLHMFDEMDDEFYQIINQMTIENNLDESEIPKTEQINKEAIFEDAVKDTIKTSDIIASNSEIDLKIGDGETYQMEILPEISDVNAVSKDTIANSNSVFQQPLQPLVCETSSLRLHSRSKEENSDSINNADNHRSDIVQNSFAEKVSCETQDSRNKGITHKDSVPYNSSTADSKLLNALTEELTKLEKLTHKKDEKDEKQDEILQTLNQSGTNQISSAKLSKEIERLKHEVRNEDVIAVKGMKFDLLMKDTKKEDSLKDDYSSTQTEMFKREAMGNGGFASSRTIHHFCVSQPVQVLSREAKNMSRFLHTPARYKNNENMNKNSGPYNALKAPWDIRKCTVETVRKTNDEDNEVENTNRMSLLAEKIVNQLMADSEIKEKNFLKLQQVVNEMFEKRRMEKVTLDPQITGENVQLYTDNDRLFQTAAHPKLSLPPHLITESLAPEYIGISDNLEEDVMSATEPEQIPASEYAEIVEDKTDEEKQTLNRILNRKHHSAMAVLHGEEHPRDFPIIYEEDNQFEEENVEEEFSSSDEDDSDDDIDLESSYRFESVLEMRRKQNKVRPDSARSHQPRTDDSITQARPHSQPNFVVRKSEPSLLQSDYNAIMKETKELSHILKSLKMEDEARSKLPAINIDEDENEVTIQNLEEFDVGNERCLSRSQSVTDLFNMNRLKVKKWKSMSDMDKMAHSMDLHPSYDVSWYKEEFWYKWFDEIYANDNQYEEMEKSNRSATLSPTSIFDDDLEFRPEAFNEDDERVTLVLKEIERLSVKISSLSDHSKLLGFHLCRRGACYRKVGDIKNALIDLNKFVDSYINGVAVELEPRLLDAYWHRHLVYRLKENTKKALEDLERITTYNHDHCNAFRSRAEICKEKGDISLAITSYSQAIRIDPKNAELYYLRAELLEKRGDTILALEDYKSATMLDKSNTHGMWKIGMYHYDTRSWMASINDFTELLNQEPKNAQAYLYRGCASAKLFHYKNAIQDLSISINLEPNNYLPFFYRGCLLRKLLPKQALQDFSVSLLLDSSLENVSSYLHRGILYTDLEKYEQASWDFEAAIRLDKTLAPAHVNLGVIELKSENLNKAIGRFNIALRMDATYVRAYLCRAEAYEKLGLIDYAIKDYTRAIVIKPGITDFRMARGRLLLKKGELELASFHIRQCAEMNSRKTASITQQAAVETFLKNFDKAINILVVARRSDLSHSLVTLLAKTKMKAERYEDAIKTFNEAISLMRPWNPKMTWPKEAADVFYFIGMCQMELKEYQHALDSFNSCLKINPEYAKAYFQRGLTKMMLGIAKGVHDFNRTLAYKPRFYQAYLGRAAYYGVKKRYAKAIMNCNEALKIKSNSVRALLYRGAIKFNIKAYQLAIKDLTAAIQIDCNCFLAFFNRAVCYHERKHYFKALRDYSIVLMSETNLKMKALLNRGLLYYQINDVENALHDFTIALKEYPDNPRIYHTIGMCYYKLHRTDEAIVSFTKALDVEPFFTEALMARGNALTGSNHPSATRIARRDYIRALHLDPQCLDARLNLAYSLQAEGHYMKAWNLFTRTLELKPDHQTSLEGRAMVNLQMSNVFGAFVDINNALAAGKTAGLFTNRGVINQALGHIVNAMQDYQTAIKLDKSCSLAYYNAANIYFLHKQFQQAITYYGRAIDWNPSDVCSYVNRGAAKSVLGQHEGALEDFEEALQFSPHWAHIYYNRGNVYAAMNMLEQADMDYTKADCYNKDFFALIKMIDKHKI